MSIPKQKTIDRTHVPHVPNPPRKFISPCSPFLPLGLVDQGMGAIRVWIKNCRMVGNIIRDDVGLTAVTQNWEVVTLPHTWNTVSADQGDHQKDPHYKNGYYRGACWYVRTIDVPADWQGRRVFLRFEAASLVAKAYLNGQPCSGNIAAHLTPFAMN